MIDDSYRDAKDELYELSKASTEDQAHVLYGCLLAFCDKLYEDVLKKIKKE